MLIYEAGTTDSLAFFSIPRGMSMSVGPILLTEVSQQDEL